MFHFTSFSCLMQDLHLINLVLLKITSCCLHVMVNCLSPVEQSAMAVQCRPNGQSQADHKQCTHLWLARPGID